MCTVILSAAGLLRDKLSEINCGPGVTGLETFQRNFMVFNDLPREK